METLINKYKNRYTVTNVQIGLLYTVTILAFIGCVSVVSLIYYP
jgi:hypothetical protein